MVVSYSFDANKYFNDAEPWAVKKKDPERMKTILFTIVQQIKNIIELNKWTIDDISLVIQEIQSHDFILPY